MGKRTNIVFIALLTFLVALRFGLLGGRVDRIWNSMADRLVSKLRQRCREPDFSAGLVFARICAAASVRELVIRPVKGL